MTKPLTDINRKQAAMFLINNSMKGFNLKREKLIRLKYSKNIISVSAPQNIVAPARAYIVTTETQGGHNVSIVLIFSKGQTKPIFFEFHKNPVSPKRAVSIEDDALSFVEDMGFEMHDLDLTDGEEVAVRDVIKKLGIFYIPHPVGVIELQPERESVLADGSSCVRIECQPIKDSDDDSVADGTQFQVMTSHGVVMNEVSGEQGAQILVQSRSGYLSFRLQSSREMGLATITVRSTSGNAKGTTRVIFIPGPPATSIVLTCTPDRFVADGTSRSMIESNPVKDACGNLVSDDTEFVVICSQGSIISQDDEEDSAQKRIVSRNAVVRFQYRASRMAGTVTITVRSTTGSSAGECSLVLDAGRPTGAISLKSSHSSVQANDRRRIMITSSPITDGAGNIISTNARFRITTSMGELYQADGTRGGELWLTPTNGELNCHFQPGKQSGVAEIVVHAENSDATGKCLVRILATSPVGTIQLQAEPKSLDADGRSVASVFTATPLCDEFGNIIENDTVFTFQVDHGRLLGLLQGNTLLSRDGHLNCEYLSPKTGGTAHILVRGPQDKSSGQLDIQLHALEPIGAIDLHSSEVSLMANETDECDIASNVIINTAGNAVSDDTIIHLRTSLGEFISHDGERLGAEISVTTTDGVIATRFRIGRKRGNCVIRASSRGGSAMGELVIPVLAEAPEGSITLRAEQNELPADGKSRVWITSAPITDAYENIVDDGSLIAVETESGRIIADMCDENEEGFHIPTKNGIIRFQLQADDRIGKTQITALSVEGFAMGAIDISFISLSAYGTIVLEVKTERAIRAGDVPVPIESEPIFDRYGNAIANNQEFIVSIEGAEGSLASDFTTAVLSPSSMKVRSQNGRLKSYFTPGTKTGTALLRVASENGEATGSLELAIEPGLPSGDIILIVHKEPLVAAADEPTMVSSEVISDEWGNMIAGGQQFRISSSPPILLSEADGLGIAGSDLIVSSDRGRIEFSISSRKAQKVLLSAVSLEGEAVGMIELSFQHQAPAGDVVLIPETPQMIADGESIVTVVSESILTASGDVVPDGTQFTVEVDSGFAFVDDQESATGDIELMSSGGIVTFHVISIPQPGTLTCKIHSREGTASGSCTIELITGPPEGSIKLETDVSVVYAGQPEPVTFRSALLVDRAGNTIADGYAFTVKAEGGLIAELQDQEPVEQINLVNLEGSISFVFFPGVQPGDVVLSITADNHSAAGQLTIPVLAAPVRQTIIIENLATEYPADGLGPVIVTSNTIKDIFGRSIADGSTVSITLRGGSGGPVDESSSASSFSVLTESGKFSLSVNKPEVSGQIEISCAIEGFEASGGSTLSFYRPLPAGSLDIRIETPADSSGRFEANGRDTLAMIVSDLYSDRPNGVFDGEPYLVQTSLGTISGGEPAPDGGGMIVRARDNCLKFNYHVARTAGTISIEIRSERGQASGRLMVDLHPGVPSGEIHLVCDRDTLIAGDPHDATITCIEAITDAHGNQVEDDAGIRLVISGGELCIPSMDSGVSELSLPVIQGRFTALCRPSPHSRLIEIEASSVDGNARGNLIIQVVAPALADTLALLHDDETFLADGRTVVSIHSDIVRNEFGQTVEDGCLFTVNLDQSVGSSVEHPERAATFPVATQHGVLTFDVVSPSDTANIAVLVASTDGTCSASTTLRFVYPEPVGTIDIDYHLTETPDAESMGAGAMFIRVGERLFFTSQPVLTEQQETVLDGALFAITASKGIIEADEGRENGDETIVSARGGVIRFQLVLPTQAGQVSLRLRSIRGSAEGQRSIEVLPGPPTGIFTFDKPRSPLIVTAEAEECVSSPLKDQFGNDVGDGWRSTVTVVGGVFYHRGQTDDKGVRTGDTRTWKDSRLRFFIMPDDYQTAMTIDCRMLDDGASASGSLTLSLFPAEPTGHIVLEAENLQLPADGRSTTVLNSGVIVNTRANAVPDGEKFIVTCDRGSISASQGELTERGIVIPAREGRLTFSLRTSKKAGPARVTVSSVSGNALGEIEIAFLPGEPTGNIHLMANPMTIVADGESTSVITCDPLTDSAGNTVMDRTILFIETDLGILRAASSSDQSEGPCAATLIDGKIDIKLISTTQAGVATIVAWSQVGNAIGNLEVSFVPGVPQGEIALLPSSQELLADGVDTTKITSLPLKDRFGNYINDREEFNLTFTLPDGNEVTTTLRPRSSKFEIDTIPIETPGNVVFTITSKNGSAKGTCILNYQPLMQEEDSEDEWFFAESESDDEEFLVGESDQTTDPKTGDDDIKDSVEESFSMLLSQEPMDDDEDLSLNIPMTRTERTKDSRIDTSSPGKSVQLNRQYADFFKFLAGF